MHISHTHILQNGVSIYLYAHSHACNYPHLAPRSSELRGSLAALLSVISYSPEKIFRWFVPEISTGRVKLDLTLIIGQVFYKRKPVGWIWLN